MDAATLLSTLDEHGFQNRATAIKLAFLNETYFDICSLEAWPFLQATATLSFNGSSPTPTNLPSDFGDVVFMQDVATRGSIDPIELQDYRWYGYDPAETGDPLYYYFIGDTIYFHPIPPSGSNTVRLDYLKIPTALAADTTEVNILIPKRHHDILWLGAIIKLQGQDDDETLMPVYTHMFDKKLSRMRADLWRKQYQRPDNIKNVEWSDDWIT